MSTDEGNETRYCYSGACISVAVVAAVASIWLIVGGGGGGGKKFKELHTTICQGYICDGESCKVSLTPIGKCYNTELLFSNISQPLMDIYGSYDITDELYHSNAFANQFGGDGFVRARSIFTSKDSSCTGTVTRLADIPLQKCFQKGTYSFFLDKA
mmetsp:Transcript_136/g.254  ORF Transcript_136/g.254 Transcript_136/m.254 type:complete len:156 (-) Transcript_136:451-918(-)